MVYLVKVRILKIFIKSAPIFDTIYGQHFSCNHHLRYLHSVISYISILAAAESAISTIDSDCLPKHEGFRGNDACSPAHFHLDISLTVYC